MPCRECGNEGRLIGLREGADESKKLLAGFGLGTAGEISPDDFNLVELADLHRYVLKYLEKPSLSVDHGRCEYPAFLFEDLSGVSIVGHELARDFVPPDVLRKRPGTKDADAIVTAPEGRVGDDNGRVRRNLSGRHNDRVELFAHPDMRAPVLLGELLERLLAFDVFLPEFSANLGISFW